MKRKDFEKEVCRLLEYGIEEYGTRYESQSKLIYNNWTLRLTKEQNYEAMQKWYHSHNHQSRTWRSKPESALKNAWSAINSLYRNADKKCFKPREQRRVWNQLRIQDLMSIIKITSKYGMQKFIFSLLVYALNKKDLKDEFPLPWKAIMKFDSCSTESYKEKIKFCEARGLISKVRECSRKEHRARAYMVRFRFSTEGEFISSLEEGLKKLLSPQKLRLRYPRWVYKKHLE